MLVCSGRLKDIMTNIFNTAKTTAETYGLGTDYLAGANNACLILNRSDWGFLCRLQKSSLFKIVSLKSRFNLLLLMQKTGIQLFHLLSHPYLGPHYHSTSLEEYKKDSRLKYSERSFRLTNF